MTESRDITLVIMFAVLNFIFQALIGQVPSLITGIPGIGYAFTIVYSIVQSVAYLMYGGRRWRIFAQGLLISLLSLLFIPNWMLPTAMATIVNVLIVDSIFNSLYGKFKLNNRLFWWILLIQIYYWTTQPLLLLPFFSLFYPLELFIAEWFLPVMSIMLPIAIVEAVAGSYLGYGIYKRVEKLIN
jgi:hypothetical protein